jgi:hypothetical protein
MMSKQTTEIKENEKTGGCCCAGKNQHRSEGAERSVRLVGAAWKSLSERCSQWLVLRKLG